MIDCDSIFLLRRRRRRRTNEGTYVGKHLGHGRLHHPRAVPGLRAVGVIRDVVVVDAATVAPHAFPGVLIFEKLGLIHLGDEKQPQEHKKRTIEETKQQQQQDEEDERGRQGGTPITHHPSPQQQQQQQKMYKNAHKKIESPYILIYER